MENNETSPQPLAEVISLEDYSFGKSVLDSLASKDKIIHPSTRSFHPVPFLRLITETDDIDPGYTDDYSF